MKILRQILSSLAKNRSDADMREELRLHIEERARQNIAAGMSADEAWRAAKRRFGGIEQIHEECREQGRSLAFEQVFQDLRYACRSLLKTPGFTALAILTLALGIGLNSSMFSLTNAVILRPLPFTDPGDLVRLFRTVGQQREGGFSRADFLDLKHAEGNVGRFAAYYHSAVSMSEAGRPAEWQNTVRVSADFFDIIGVRPILGRTFQPEEDANGRHRVLVLSHGLWQDRFAGTPDVVGRSVHLNGESYEIIGVLPESSHDRRLFGNARMFRPLGFTDAERVRRDIIFLNVIGRRNPGVGKAEFTSFVASTGARLAADFAAENGTASWRTTGLLASTVKPPVSKLLALLVGLAASVLLVACSNLANFTLARAVSRTRESAMRMALGASRLRLLRPIVLEAVVLSVVGGVAALFVMHWTVAWLNHEVVKAGDSPVVFVADWRVVSFTFAVSLATILVFGIAAALFTLRINATAALKSDSPNATRGRAHHRIGRALIVIQFVFATTLVAAAGFMIRGADHVLKSHHGWDAERVMQGHVQLPTARYRNEQSVQAFQQRALEQLQSVPGVDSASLSYGLPYRGLNGSRRYVADAGESGTPASQGVQVGANAISNDYFKVTGTRLLRGRPFGAHDSATSPKVAILSESAARALAGDRDPIGLRIRQAETATSPWVEIVGVVEDAQSLDQADVSTRAQFYEPLTQDVWYNGDGKIAEVFVAVRTVPGLDPSAVQDGLKAAIMAVDHDLPLRGLMPATALVARAAGAIHLTKRLLSAFALLGLFLAAIGISGLVARDVNQRTAEIGLRMALGAQVKDVLRLILAGGVRTAGIGAALGVLLGFATGRLVASAFPAMRTGETLVCVAAAAILMLTSLAACYVPARRAAKVTPMAALRSH